MNYTKPELIVLGEAARVIEQFPQVKGRTGLLESVNRHAFNPAYELDE
ncbi:MAG: hypothetical protein WB558_03045 [Terriglobales bacterium]